MALSAAFTKATCKIGTGATTCRFLVADANGLQCAKLDASLRGVIDWRVVNKTMNAQGDNCPGVARDD